ncbi:GH11781 [Drosophila grimshawi]|uniref:GH11781 n=1 Tax=Drosophila grimshawi TaxID=7222 RepID=B4K0I9_DROGR|nr:GH11781 [Drosophila grimshawi]
MELSSLADIDNAAELFLRNINVAAEYSMLGQLPCSPPSPTQPLLKPEVLDLVRHKRALRRQYMLSRNPLDPRDFRGPAHELRKLLFDIKSKYFQHMLPNADPNKKNGLNLWKAMSCVKRQPLRRVPIMRPDNTWCRSNAEIASAFADELEGRFTPFALASPCQSAAVTQRFLDGFSTWAKRWNICVNESKSQHCMFALRNGNCLTVRLNNKVIPQENHARYLGTLHF